jgi:carbonic anhydrase
MRLLERLFDSNKRWAGGMLARDPQFFDRLVHQQRPEFLWIGCSDSRVPANEIVGLLPGEMFVHRNVANVVVHTDLNCLSVLQYAVDVLGVQHVIVCGHYGCGGVRAALAGERHGLVDNWLQHVRDVHATHRGRLDAVADEERHEVLCELNVAEQVRHVCETTIVQDAWQRGQALAVHGWIYSLEDGRLRDLDLCIGAPEDVPLVDRMAARRDRPWRRPA